MAIPRIEFCNSWIYDEHWRQQAAADQEEYPPYEKLAGKIKRIERAWAKEGEGIMREMSRCSHLKWREKKIQCFVVGRAVPFSYPLTISEMRGYPIDFTVDVLTHELVHQLFIQNEKEMDKAWNHLFRKYKKEEFNAVIHVPVHAIHCQVFRQLWGEKRLRREMDFASKYPAYKSAWEIVMEEGAENILAEMKGKMG